jgi:hypothetical protein
MTVTLELKPEVEERIVAEAKARGLSVENYILNVLERGDEWRSEFRFDRNSRGVERGVP